MTKNKSEHFKVVGHALSCDDESILSLTFRRLVLENAEAIGKALVELASKGHYNAAHLLLELAGIGAPAKAMPELTMTEPRIFLLDLVDKLMLREPAETGKQLEQLATEDGRLSAASLKGHE